MNLVQFRYCWDWGTYPLYRIQWFPHLIVHKHVNALGTKRSVRSIVNGHFSGVSVCTENHEDRIITVFVFSPGFTGQRA